MPDMDGCAETVVILAYATKTIQCTQPLGEV